MTGRRTGRDRDMPIDGIFVARFGQGNKSAHENTADNVIGGVFRFTNSLLVAFPFAARRWTVKLRYSAGNTQFSYDGRPPPPHVNPVQMSSAGMVSFCQPGPRTIMQR